jgi:hypothetical protein
MKWDETKIEKLERLINEYKKPIEIIEELGVTKKALSLKMNKLGLKIKYKKSLNCVNCGIEFEAYTNNTSKFCSNSCSATHTNKNKKLTQKTKEKIKKSLLVFFKDNQKKEKPLKKCKNCNNIINEKFKYICVSCKIEYYQFYRMECKFDFNVYDYPERFDLDLIKKHGWYSASNRGNNLNGVSKDHMFSVKDGFKLKISPHIIKHPANCKLMIHTENNIKKTNSTLTLGELLDRIKNW